jgi:inorganic pyrophosphatase
MRAIVALAIVALAQAGGPDKFWVNAPMGDSWDKSKLTTETAGEHPSLDFRVYYNYDGKRISPWHDIPLKAPARSDEPNGLYHFVCEIPKGTTAKMEVNKEDKHNPIAQDTKKGKLRYYKYNPEVGSLCNYGAIMQTWEDPEIPHPDTQAGGDNDPLDVLQVNARPCKMGELYEVRVLGTLAMVDDGETDWKLIVVDADDAATKSWKDIDDVPKEKVDELREWFRLYKTAEGKGENKFGLDEKAMPAAYALEVIKETHGYWKDLAAKYGGKTEL